MPHEARKKSESGYYHVVPKGIADQILFLDDADRELYVRLLADASKAVDVLVHAYCLMSNHVHLVMEDPNDELSGFMKYVGERYAMHFAEKTGRRGGVFRKPFWSEPIKSNEHLLSAVRYVHANPAAAGICSAKDYSWSSMHDYLGKRNGLAHTATILDMCGGVEGFLQFSDASNDTAAPFPGSRLRAHLSDDEAAVIMRHILGDSLDLNLSRYSLEIRRQAVAKLLDRGFSTTRIARICGVSQSFASRCAE